MEIATACLIANARERPEAISFHIRDAIAPVEPTFDRDQFAAENRLPVRLIYGWLDDDVSDLELIRFRGQVDYATCLIGTARSNSAGLM